MLKAGETVVTAVSMRDFIMVFGNFGTIQRIWFDADYNVFKIEKV